MPAILTLHIRENIPLRDHTTFRVGGPARFFCEVSAEAELVEAVAFAREKCGGNIFVLGGGSNVLVSDEGFDGLVIHMKLKGVEFGEEKDAGISGVSVTAAAGEDWDGFVSQCVSRGFSGLENLSGIPGTVGAAPVQNIGAYGGEVARFVESVRAYDLEKKVFRIFSNKECGFEYRESIFKKEKVGACGRFIIVSVLFRLQKEGAVNIGYKDLAEYFANANVNADAALTPADVRNAVLAIRGRKLPDVHTIGTAGSFFKNPIISAERYAVLKKKYPDLPSFPAEEHEKAKGGGVVKVPLAWILDHVCGYKGIARGDIGTYKNQALVIVNNGVATAAGIRKFADEIAAAVKEKTSIEIEPEVQYV